MLRRHGCVCVCGSLLPAPPRTPLSLTLFPQRAVEALWRGAAVPRAQVHEAAAGAIEGAMQSQHAPGCDQGGGGRNT